MIFVYTKDEEVKILEFPNHLKLTDEGWKHIATIDAAGFFRELVARGRLTIKDFL